MEITEQSDVAVVEEELVDPKDTIDEVVKQQRINEELRLTHQQEIVDLRAVVHEAEDEFVAADKKAKRLKKTRDELQDDLNALIDRGPDYQRQLPFGTDDKPEESKEHAELMRTPALDVFENLTASQLAKFEELKIDTLQDFEDLRGGKKADYPRGLVDVKGWGENAITKLENEVEAFLVKHQKAVHEEPETFASTDSAENVNADDEVVYEDVED